MTMPRLRRLVFGLLFVLVAIIGASHIGWARVLALLLAIAVCFVVFGKATDEP